MYGLNAAEFVIDAALLNPEAFPLLFAGNPLTDPVAAAAFPL
jgi:hypothetical protein